MPLRAPGLLRCSLALVAVGALALADRGGASAPDRSADATVQARTVGGAVDTGVGSPAPAPVALPAEPARTDAGTADHGLVPDAWCGDALRIGGTDLCTHGDDAPAPDTAAAGSSTVAEAGAPPDACADGALRVQALYAHAGSTASRAGELVPRIRGWAGAVDQVFRQSSGGARSVRWAASAGSCTLDVAVVHLSAEAAGSFPTTVRELRAAGFDRPDRRYLVWFDADVYCGVATLQHDDRPDGSNRNNGAVAAYGRIDRGCWGGATEAHELVHMLGGVQRSAPNATRLGHCRDEADLLCYADEAGVQVRQVCGADFELRLDCRGDDYFNVAPPAGSYLATHWNVASSAFLVGAPRPSSQLDYELRGAVSGARRSEQQVFAAGVGPARVSLRFDPGASEDHVDVAADALAALAAGDRQVSASRPATWTVRLLDPAGRPVAEEQASDGAVELAVDLRQSGDHTLEVRSDGSGSWSATVTVRRP